MKRRNFLTAMGGAVVVGPLGVLDAAARSLKATTALSPKPRIAPSPTFTDMVTKVMRTNRSLPKTVEEHNAFYRIMKQRAIRRDGD